MHHITIWTVRIQERKIFKSVGKNLITSFLWQVPHKRNSAKSIQAKIVIEFGQQLAVINEICHEDSLGRKLWAYWVEGPELNTLCHSDDVVVIAEIEEDLKNTTQEDSQKNSTWLYHLHKRNVPLELNHQFEERLTNESWL